MRCLYYRWKISESIDNKAEMPSSLSRHLRKCSGCREFYRNSIAIGMEMSRADMMKCEFDSGVFAETVSGRIDSSEPVSGRRRMVFPYKAAAAGVLLLILISATVGLYNKEDSDHTRNLPPFPDISKTTHIASMISEPYHKEFKELRKSAESAVKFAISCTGLKTERLGINIDFLTEKEELSVSQ